MADTVPPKPPGQRRRRNADQGQWRKLPAKGARDVPRTPTGLGVAGKRWWKLAWQSPMSAAYIDADRPALELGARLADQAAAGDLSVLPELRHLRAELGLSPLARQKLRWQLDETTDRVAPPPRRPRRDLRVVS